MVKCTTTKNPLTFAYKLMLLVIVGGIFYSSYGLSNYFASQKSDVAEIFFDWEQSIPFLAWTIIPYWSLNGFYALAFFLCKNRDELHYYVKQLLIAQLIAVLCFLLLPLQFSWQKPETDGLFGVFFGSLASFDKPYNQAPSLHIALSVIIGRFYWQRFTGFWRGVWLIWVLLIAASVLTTYQHHFIDIPTGLLLGVLIIWALPAPKQNVFQHRHRAGQSQRRWAIFYGLLSVAFLFLADVLSTASPAYLWLLYPAVSCLTVASAYAFLGIKALQKQANGKLSIAATLLLLPYLLGVRLNMAYWLRGKAKFHTMIDNINVGSLTAAKHFSHVIDVCGEYPCFAEIEHYQCIPLLDMVAPDPEILSQAAQALEQQHNNHHRILVCCALGYGRSVAVILTWLVGYRHCQNLDEAIKMVQNTHTHMVLPNKTRIAIAQAIRFTTTAQVKNTQVKNV